MIIEQLSDKLRDSADELLRETPQGERITWLQHPLTQSLLKTLNADYLDYHNGWENGSFTTESIEGTAQANAEALGSVKAISLIIGWIEDVPSPQEELDDDKTHGA